MREGNDTSDGRFDRQAAVGETGQERQKAYLVLDDVVFATDGRLQNTCEKIQVSTS